MSKRTPPSDEYSACAALRFPRRARQFEAYQPGGNGTYGQAKWLSLAACGGCCDAMPTIGAGGATRNARRRHAHRNFIIVSPCNPLAFKRPIVGKVQSRNHRAAETARSFSNHGHSRKTGTGFQPIALLHPKK
ncbi:hypothetical protein [Bradyrhizobium glycinis]|uniref:hypothetical protein n=1 Tax=Bradyrhizobium glycinis TaxID=2751812 RepID=UPI0018D5EFE9|nr:hypothetical protein [Bradyrhizobium glycinis]MBH5371461.1 hypothetical protein [Bradyrhizobium glycinis]